MLDLSKRTSDHRWAALWPGGDRMTECSYTWGKDVVGFGLGHVLLKWGDDQWGSVAGPIVHAAGHDPEAGPDWCEGCSSLISEWVAWPCPTAVSQKVDA